MIPRLRAGPVLLALSLALSVTMAAPATARGQQQGGVTLGSETNLPLPRYVSLRSHEVNVRRGPGLEYRIDWVFQRSGLPVRIIDEYGHWRRIADSDDAGGWVYHALLTGRRTALVVVPRVAFRAEPAEAAPVTAQAEQGVVAHLLRCRTDWCELEAEGTKGWVLKAEIWGVDTDEEFGG